jgi:hypothetical protein
MDGNTTLKLMETDREKKFLLDPYLDWVAAEGPPCHEGFSIDALTAETGMWPRFDCKGAFLHVRGRGDYISVYALDLEGSKKTAPVKHIYECFVYVLEGHGSTVVDLPGGKRHTFEWGPRSLFAIPLNVKYQLFNGSGRDRALLACTTSLPMTMNVYHNQGFIFDNSYVFADRIGDPKYYEGDGDFISIKPGRHVWETNFIPDLLDLDLRVWNERGAGGSSLTFCLADAPMHAHTSQIPTARYKKAHRHSDGTHIWAVDGSGYSMLWYDEGDREFIEVPWRHGVVYAPPFMMFHQHFNTAHKPARYLAVSMGNSRYPIFRFKRESTGGKIDTDVKRGGDQVEYADQDPRLHKRWLEELSKTGVKPDMSEFLDSP